MTRPQVTPAVEAALLGVAAQVESHPPGETEMTTPDLDRLKRVAEEALDLLKRAVSDGLNMSTFAGHDDGCRCLPCSCSYTEASKRLSATADEALKLLQDAGHDLSIEPLEVAALSPQED